MPRLIIFSSGTKQGGGSGFEKLVEHQRTGKLRAEIVAVVSNWSEGGVMQRALQLNVPFEHFAAPYTVEAYKRILNKYKAEWISLSGWLKLVPVADLTSHKDGLDPRKTINIHPGPLPLFGGPGMYGFHVHQAVFKALEKGEIQESGPTMHFVTAEYDKGPLIFYKGTSLDPKKDTPETISQKVHQIEHEYQFWVTNLVVNGYINWDGIDPASLKVPQDYQFLPKPH